MYIYARGSGSNLTIDSNISTANDLRLSAQGSVNVTGHDRHGKFQFDSGGDLCKRQWHGHRRRRLIVTSQNGDIDINSGAFHAGSDSVSLSLTAGNAVNITMGSDLSIFESAASISVSGSEINLIGDDLVTLNLKVTSPAMFTAGDGGINAPNVNFVTTGDLKLRSDGDIDIYGADIPGEERLRLPD